MKIGELAEHSGLAPSAIRFYEQSGLLPDVQRGSNGYRSYSDAALHRLRLIQIAQNLGFSLDVLRDVFAHAGHFPSAQLQSALETRLSEIDTVMASLRAQRKDLVALREQMAQSQNACVDMQAMTGQMSSPNASKAPRAVASKRGARGQKMQKMGR